MKGDTIGLVMPAGPVQNEEHFVAGVRLLREMGFAVKFGQDVPDRKTGYLAGDDAERAREVHELWADPEVKALLAVRGGYGCLRTVELLDMELIRQHPKLFIGFSDVSVLLAALTKATGLVTFHGPVLTTLTRSDPETIQSFFEALTGRLPRLIRPGGIEILASGPLARGRLLGGNLTTLTHLLATPHELSWRNALVFLEDVGEPAYRLDRLLTHLKQAGRLDKLAGLLLGSFHAFHADSGEDSCETADAEQVWNRALELLGNDHIPIWGNFPVGHGVRNLVLPLGVEAELDSGNGTLRLLGPCTAPR